MRQEWSLLTPKERTQHTDVNEVVTLVLLMEPDPTAPLAAISARLSAYVPPAESEIARIKRLAFASASDNVVTATVEESEPQSQTQSPSIKADKESGDIGEPCSDADGTKLTESSKVEAKRSPRRSTATSNAVPASKGGVLAATQSGASSVLHDSVIAEEWVNVRLETSGSYLLPTGEVDMLLRAADIAEGKRSDDAIQDGEDGDGFAFRRNGPLARAGIDRFSLYRLGMPKELVDRLFRALYVYTNGFHNIINEIAAHCPPRVEKHVSSNVWLTFLLLLEQCENGKYEMAMLKFKHATEERRKRTEDERESERAAFDAQKRTLELQLHAEATRSSEKSAVIEKLATDLALASQTVRFHTPVSDTSRTSCDELSLMFVLTYRRAAALTGSNERASPPTQAGATSTRARGEAAQRAARRVSPRLRDRQLGAAERSVREVHAGG